MKNTVNLWTDGSAWHKDRLGAYAYILEGEAGEVIHQQVGVVEDTTISRMELMAVIEGVRFLEKPHLINVMTDSEYVQKGATVWRPNWERSGWKIVNADLWVSLVKLIDKHEVKFEHVKGHSGIKLNEEVDQLCSNAVKQFRKTQIV